MASRPYRFAIMSMVVASLTLLTSIGFCQQDAGSGGIEIDVNGILHSRTVLDQSGKLTRQRLNAAKSSLNKDLQKQSPLRKISLNRLEAEIKKLQAAGKPIPDEMRYMAGLNRVTHVFYFPETKDIVLAGPAEGFFIDGNNRVVGIKSRQATLQLEDMIVALRAFGPDTRPTGMISCSIDPTQQGLQQMKVAMAEVQQNFRPGDERRVVELYKNALGLQDVTVKGVSPKTHFARVLVDADYHMKLIGIGLEQPPVRITSFIEKAKPNTVGKNSLQRWYFEPDYSYVTVSADETAMMMDGGSVKLIGEDERVSAKGQRSGTGGMNRASQGFCRSFTKMYNSLSEKNPLYAELRNLIDMSVAAAFIQEMDMYSDAGWSMELFGNEELFPVEKYNAPKHVEPAVNAVWKGDFFMTPIGGGVQFQPRLAISADYMMVDEKGEVMETKKTIKVEDLTDGQWWWD
ncbi:MAG: DUF1598 domain-containing protein [Mariniblastus sp.]|nr:DUF1598 domain-containing protein [Mariniblastus sp.]